MVRDLKLALRRFHFRPAHTAFLLLAIALVACWLPLRRAIRVDPAVALRVE